MVDEYTILIDLDSDWMAVYREGLLLEQDHESAFDPPHLLDVLCQEGMTAMGKPCFISPAARIVVRYVDMDQASEFPVLLAHFPGGDST